MQAYGGVNARLASDGRDDARALQEHTGGSRVRYVSGRGGEFSEAPQRHRARSRKFVLVEFLTAMEKSDIWRFAAGKAPFPELYG